MGGKGGDGGGDAKIISVFKPCYCFFLSPT